MSSKKPSLLEHDVAFRRYYNLHLKPLEQHFETLRRKAVKQLYLRVVAATTAWLTGLTSIIYLAESIGELWWFVGFFALVCALGLGAWAWLPAGAHKLRLQDQVLTRIVPYFGNLHYRPDPDLQPSNYLEWKIFPKFSKCHSEDQIEGIYHDVELKLAELRLQYEYRSSHDDSTSTRTAFEGLMIVFELEEEFSGVTLIRSEGSDMGGDFKLDPLLQPTGQGNGFEVYSTPGAPGSNLAGTWLLDRLEKVYSLFEAKQLFASFHHHKLVMLIQHKGDYFEMSHRRQTNFAKDAERIKDQLSRFFSIVDMLQLRGNAENTSTRHEHRPEPALSLIQKDQNSNNYDIGGWGCLAVFLMFILSMALFLIILDPALSKAEQLGWAALGGFLATIGIYQITRNLFKFSVWGLLFGVLFLAGTLTILYFHGGSDIQILLHTWFMAIEIYATNLNLPFQI